MAASGNGRKAAAAARAEKKPEKKTVEFRGLTLELADTLPGTVLFDITYAETENDVLPVYRLLKSIVGPGQFTDIRNVIEPDENVNETVEALLGECFEQYGMTLGKS